MNWDELTHAVARRVYAIEMADGLVPSAESNARYDRYEAWLKDPSPGGYGGSIVQIHHVVGTALIVMKEMGLVKYE